MNLFGLNLELPPKAAKIVSGIAAAAIGGFALWHSVSDSNVFVNGLSKAAEASVEVYRIDALGTCAEHGVLNRPGSGRGEKLYALHCRECESWSRPFHPTWSEQHDEILEMRDLPNWHREWCECR